MTWNIIYHPARAVRYTATAQCNKRRQITLRFLRPSSPPPLAPVLSLSYFPQLPILLVLSVESLKQRGWALEVEGAAASGAMADDDAAKDPVWVPPPVHAVGIAGGRVDPSAYVEAPGFACVDDGFFGSGEGEDLCARYGVGLGKGDFDVSTTFKVAAVSPATEEAPDGASTEVAFALWAGEAELRIGLDGEGKVLFRQGGSWGDDATADSGLDASPLVAGALHTLRLRRASGVLSVVFDGAEVPGWSSLQLEEAIDAVGWRPMKNKLYIRDLEVVYPPPPPALRNCYAVSLLAGEGVKTDDLLAQLEGLRAAGLQVLTRDAIDAAAGDDESLAAEVAAFKEADPPAPISSAVCAKLLQKLFSKTATEEAQDELTAEGSIGELVRLPHGPRSFKIFVNDFPTSGDLATMSCAVEGGTPDCVILVTAPPPPPPPAPPEESGEEAPPAEDPAPEPTEEEKLAEAQFLAEGRAREQVFADFTALVTREGVHKTLANIAFDSLQLTAKTPDAEGYCNAEASVEALGGKLLEMVKARLAWLHWRGPLNHVDTAPQEINLRHYDEALAAAPVSAMSVLRVGLAFVACVQMWY